MIECPHPFLITNPNTLYYLTRFTTPGAAFAALVRDAANEYHFIVRDLESTNWVSQDADIRVHTYAESDPMEIVCRLLDGCSVVAYDATSPRLTVAEFARRPSSVGTWIDISPTLLNLCVYKTPTEVACIQTAAGYVTKGYERALSTLRPGRTETEVAAEMAHGIKAAGSEYTVYPEFVSSGRNGLRGHFAASRSVLEEDSLLFMELGAAHKRYHAAKMHTVYLGRSPPVWFFDAELAIRTALRTARLLCRDGVVCCHVDAAMRRIIESSVSESTMQRRSGYTLGIGCCVDWSDGTIRLNPTSTDVLRTGMVLHVIPWIQRHDTGGIGFSDVIVVGDDCGQSLFDHPLPSQYPRCVLHHPCDPPCSIPPLAIYPPIPATPMVNDGPLYFKDERARSGARSFKIIGVEWAIHNLLRSGTLRANDTVISQTDGNHGEALALVARRNSLRCHVVVPHNVSRERIDVLCDLGADVTIVDGSYDECIVHMKQLAETNGWTIVSDTSWTGYTDIPKQITNGYCMLFAEAIGAMGQPPTHAIVQAGVGTLLSAACRTLPLTTRLVCVEPVDAACIYENVRRGSSSSGLHPCSGTTNSIMQGLNCGTPSVDAYDIICDRVNDFVAVGDDYATEAVRWLHGRGLSTSPTGAAGLAGYLAARDLLGIDETSRVLVVLTEGITDTGQFKRLTNGIRAAS